MYGLPDSAIVGTAKRLKGRGGRGRGRYTLPRDDFDGWSLLAWVINTLRNLASR